MQRRAKLMISVLMVLFIMSGCSQGSSVKSGEQAGVPGTTVEVSQDRTRIVLSDEEIKVDNKTISTDSASAVYVGGDIVYYEEGKDETYGEGGTEDAHSREEAKAHKVITITKPGTYEISGSISAGQIAVDLGKKSEDNPKAVVNLVLNNAEITCSVAPSILVLNAYECGEDDEENATPTVDTTAAGFNLILAKDSENIINGAYVAKIYENGTTKEDIEEDEAEKKYKFDAAIDSQVSFNIDSEENGKLTVNAENEGISGALHMTINSGEIVIHSHDDAMNTSEDNVSVLTINGGVITCDAGFGDEGDGIDSNGYITMNDGYVIAGSNGMSMDSGIDSDLGIYINGGTLFACGNMYDEISKDSKQSFEVFGIKEKVKENELIMITDDIDEPIAAFSAVNDCGIAVYSSSLLTKGPYHLYKVSSVTGDLKGSIYTNITEYEDAMQLEYTSDFMGGGFGGRMPGGERPEKPEGMEFPEGERPKMP